MGIAEKNEIEFECGTLHILITRIIFMTENFREKVQARHVYQTARLLQNESQLFSTIEL